MAVGPLQTNCYLAICPETKKAAVIDPGWSGAAIYDRARQAGASIETILFTHAHFDHVAGAAELKQLCGAPILAHENAETMIAHARSHAQAWGFQIDPVPLPDAHLVEGEDVAIGTLVLRVLATPGHSPGHVSLVAAGEPVAFVGDVLFRGSIGRTDLPGGNYEQLIQSIREKLLVLPAETAIYPGHGDPTTIGFEQQYNPFLR